MYPFPKTHPLPTTQEKTLLMDVARWSIQRSDWLYSLQPKMEKFYAVSKNKIWSWLCLRSWTAAAAKSLQSRLTLCNPNSVWPQGRQLTRLSLPWDSPGKNTGVGCHFLLQCMKVKSESEVAQSSLALRDPMDCSLPGSSVHGIFQAGVLEWGAIAFSEIMNFLLPNSDLKWRSRESH